MFSLSPEDIIAVLVKQLDNTAFNILASFSCHQSVLCSYILTSRRKSYYEHFISKIFKDKKG